MYLDCLPMEWMLQVVDEVDDAVSVLRLFALGWVRRTDRRRVVRVTDSGQENLPGTLGLAPDWDQPAPVSRSLTA